MQLIRDEQYHHVIWDRMAAQIKSSSVDEQIVVITVRNRTWILIERQMGARGITSGILQRTVQ